MSQMRDDNINLEFSLFGGLLHQLGIRSGLIRNQPNSIRLGFVLSLLAWGVLMILAFFQGFGQKMFSLPMIGVHVRFLVAIPLFCICETLVIQHIRDFVRHLVHAGLVPETELPNLASNIDRIHRIKKSLLPEAVIFIIVLLSSLIGIISGKTVGWAELFSGHFNGHILVQDWYLFFCLPLFRFLLLRWVWQLGLWWYFLWTLQKLKLRLIPIHSDGVAGLGYLEVVQEHFMLLIIAISSVLSATFARDIILGSMTFDALYHLIPAVLILNLILFIGPLFIFFHDLWTCQKKGMDEYMVMAAHYAHAFDRKWIRNDAAETKETPLGSGDIQSLADITSSFNIISTMRAVPASRRLIIEIILCVILPFTPLILLKYPINELMIRLFQILTG